MHSTDERRAAYLERGTRAYRRANLALFFAGFATFSSMYSVQPLMPVFSHEFGVSAAVSSLSLSVTTGVLAFTLFAAGLLSGAIERKNVMTISLFGTAALSLLAAAAPGWSTLLTARALQGIALGGVPALAITYLSEEVKASDVGAATGLYIGGTAFGGMGGRVISGLVADAFGWRVALATLGVIGFAAAAAFIWLLPRSRNFQARHGLSIRDHVRPIVAHMRHRALPWVFFCGFLFMGSFVSVYNYVAYRLSEPPFALGQGAIGSVFTIYLLGVVTSAIAGRIADRTGRTRVLILAIVLMGIGLALMEPDSMVAIIAGLGVLTVGFFAGHATASGWVGLLAEDGKGHAAGLYLLGYYLGSSVVGSIGGLFWSGFGWPGVVAMVAVLLLAAMAVVIRLMIWQRAD